MQHWLYAARNLKLLAIFSSGKSIHGWWHHRVLHVTKLLFVASYNISPSNPHDPSQFYLHSPDMMGSNYSYIPKTSTLYIPIFPYVPYFNLHQLSEKQKVNNITTTSGDSATAWKTPPGAKPMVPLPQRRWLSAWLYVPAQTKMIGSHGISQAGWTTHNLSWSRSWLCINEQKIIHCPLVNIQIAIICVYIYVHIYIEKPWPI